MSNGFHVRTTLPILRNAIHGFGYPNLLNKEFPTGTKSLQARPQSDGVVLKKPWRDFFTLYNDKLAWVGLRPLLTVVLENFQLNCELVR